MGAVIAIFGLYLVGPWYVILPESAAFGVLVGLAPLLTKLVSVMHIIGGIGMIVGAVKDHQKNRLLFLWIGISSYAIIVALRLMTVGPIPLIWLFQLGYVLMLGALILSRKGG